MGIFRKKKTYVSSVVYNMAGDEFERPNYLRTTVVGTVLGGNTSMADSITGSYLNGPGMRFRSFYKWANRTKYNDLIGLVTGSIQTGNSIDNALVTNEISVAVGAPILMQSATTALADYSYWADQYVGANFPQRLGTNYATDMAEDGTIKIVWEDLSISEFTPVDFDKAATYLYAVYSLTAAGGNSPLQVYIYKRNSGNAVLDGMFSPSGAMNGFYPVIPFRLNNKFVSEEYLPEVYEQAKKGYKKATTGRFDKLVDELKDNPDLDDIDYTYMVFGVCLNVLEQASRKYIFKFFEEVLNDYPTAGNSSFEEWETDWNSASGTWSDWFLWKEAQAKPADPLYGTPEPERVSYPSMPTNSLRVSTGSNPTINYDITLSWNSITQSSGSGLLKPDAKRDQIWFTKGDSREYTQDVWVEGAVPEGETEAPWKQTEGTGTTANTITLNWQVTETSWRTLTIVGLKHRNLIYGGKAVEIEAFEALDDPEESGFIIPLHDGVFRAMGLKDGTQMTTACSFMVFNCYQVVKQKWYQTTIFKIILVIIVIAIFVYTGYYSGETMGLLGSNAAVGGAILGTTAVTTLSIIVGAVANALAAMLLTKLITAGSTALFGEKWGAIIGAIASIVALQVGTSMMNGQSFASSFSGLMKADNILKLTTAAGQGYSGYINAANQDIFAEQQAVLDAYKVESKEIRETWEQTLGHGNGMIDPLALTSVFGVTMEDMDSFLQRTLMTGSDVADMSMGMLTNFVRITLNTDLPT